MDYSELVKDLRYCADMDTYCSSCKYFDVNCEQKLIGKAADAIEKLTAYVRQIEELRKDGYYLQKTKMMTYGQANEPCEGRTPSNADRIRAMTDEELAQFFHDCVACDDCPVGDRKCKRAFPLCKNTALAWLKSPVEVDDD